MPQPIQTPTPEQTPEAKSTRPHPPARNDSEYSTTEMDDNESGYESRSRSQSRRRRRQNQRQRQAQGKAESGNAKADSMAQIEELEEEPEPQPRLKNPHPSDLTEMQPFERLKPPSQSMDGPVTYARALRGEIPMRGAAPDQPLDTAQSGDAKTGAPDPMDQDGLKLRIELNIDIEIELKASIHGDLTLALLA